MYKKVFSRSDLVKRIEILEAPSLNMPITVSRELHNPASLQYLKQFVADLDTAKENLSRIRRAFKNTLQLSYRLNSIRHELAHIPVFFTLRKSRRRIAGPKLEEYIEAKNEVGSFDLPSKACPYNVLPSKTITNFLKPERPLPIWCNYPKALAQEIGFEIIKTWDIDDSLPDWLNIFIEQEPTTTAIQVETDWDTEDRRYTVYFRSTDTEIYIPISLQQLPIEEQIYHFIRQYAPLNSGMILEKFFQQDESKRYKLTRILNRLAKRNLIEKLKKGVYIPKY